MEKIAEKAFKDELEKLSVSPQAVGRALAGRQTGGGYESKSFGDNVRASLYTHKITSSNKPNEMAKKLIKEMRATKPNLMPSIQNFLNIIERK